MTFTFDTNIVSDLHKEAYMFRPSQDWWAHWNSASDALKQIIWDSILDDQEAAVNRDFRETTEALGEFIKSLDGMVSLGAKDRTRALLWLFGPRPRDIQDIEHWVWEQGIHGTATARWAVETLIKEFEVAA